MPRHKESVPRGLDYTDVYLSDFEDSSDEEWEDVDELYPSQSTLYLDLWSLLQTEKKDDDETAKAQATPDSKNVTAPRERCTNKAAANEMDNTCSLVASLLREVGSAKPRLVRSSSFPGGSVGNLAPPSLRRSRSAMSLSTFATTMPPQHSHVIPNVHCIQGLLPTAVHPCALGPTARASMGIVSSRAAVAIIWSRDDQDVRVVPLIGCGDNLKDSWNVAKMMQAKLQERLSAYQDGSWTGYLRVCEEIASRKDEFTRLLNDLITTESSATSHSLHCLKAVCKRQGLSLGESKDHFDLFRMVHQSTSNLTTASTPQYSDDSDDSNTCLVCFEELSDGNGVVELIPCGHSLCSECLTAYIASAAGSGQSSVRCAAFKCPTRLDIYDMAHALFDDANQNEHDSGILFEKLMKFETEKSGTELCLAKGKTRFCPSPFCNRVLVSYGDGDVNIGGSNMFLCTCGVSLCADKCKDGVPSHPGISCSKFQELLKAIDSGKFDAEIAR